ncbi:MAG: L,D-transpeptidase, partial [Hyphomicrobiaceae bacterium]
LTISAAGNASAQTGWPWDVLNSSSSSSSSGGSIFGGYASGRSAVSFPKRYRAGQIIVSFSDRRLYHVTSRGRAMSYPITAPRKQSRWSGTHHVSRKQVNPTWTPTPAMRKENPRLPAYVPGGHKKNPLGVRALYLGSTMYRIHGTDAPWTIGKAVSKGCIRMHNAHVVELYRKVRVGTRVTVTWNSYRS